MRHCVAVVLSVLVAAPALSAPPELNDEKSRLEALTFVGQISIFKGYFDSVAEFCKPHVPAFILQDATNTWNGANREALKFRDSELDRLIAVAKEIDVPQDKLDQLAGWPGRYHREAMTEGVMVKDLKEEKDLKTACAQRLGEMGSTGMSLQKLSPGAWDYLQKLQAK